MISFKEFKNVEMKIGRIKSVEEIPDSRSLIKLQVDFGDETRQVIAGIKKTHTKENLEGKQFVFVTNLEPATLMGQKSEAMVLAAVKGEEVVLVQPEREIDEGSGVE